MVSDDWRHPRHPGPELSLFAAADRYRVRAVATNTGWRKAGCVRGKGLKSLFTAKYAQIISVVHPPTSSGVGLDRQFGQERFATGPDYWCHER